MDGLTIREIRFDDILVTITSDIKFTLGGCRSCGAVYKNAFFDGTVTLPEGVFNFEDGWFGGYDYYCKCDDYHPAQVLCSIMIWKKPIPSEGGIIRYYVSDEMAAQILPFLASDDHA